MLRHTRNDSWSAAEPGGVVRTKDAPFANAHDLLKASSPIEVAYRSVLDVLTRATAPAQTKTKASPRFVFDQTALQEGLRADLSARGFTYGRALSADVKSDGINIRGIQADSIGHRVHVVLEFGNRASWAHNLLTRVTGAVAGAFVDLTIVVVPTDEFSRRIDTNLATFERVVANLRLLERWNACSIPGPLIVVGVEPETMLP